MFVFGLGGCFRVVLAKFRVRFNSALFRSLAIRFAEQTTMNHKTFESGALRVEVSFIRTVRLSTSFSNSDSRFQNSHYDKHACSVRSSWAWARVLIMTMLFKNILVLFGNPMSGIESFEYKRMMQ